MAGKQYSDVSQHIFDYNNNILLCFRSKKAWLRHQLIPVPTGVSVGTILLNVHHPRSNSCKVCHHSTLKSLDLVVTRRHTPGFRTHILNQIKGFASSRQTGIFLNSCFAHCQSERQDTWFANDSPKIRNKVRTKTIPSRF